MSGGNCHQEQPSTCPPPTAVLLAAGRGRRLGPRGTSLPKGAIELGGESLTARTLRLLTEFGITRCIIVTGHEAAWYRGLTSPGVNLEFVHNARFMTTGSLWSLTFAAAQVDGDALVIESDLIYERRALATMVGTGASDAVLMSQPTGSGDEVYVDEQEGRLAALSKDPAGFVGEAAGEFVGLARMTRSTLTRLCAVAEGEGGESMEYEHGLTHIAGTNRIEVISVPDLLWAEIDTEDDLKRVRCKIWPRISGDASRT